MSSPTSLLDRSIARPHDLPASAIAEFSRGMTQLPHVLKKMGWDDLRPGQKDVVKTVMMGYDCVGILPTAAGKTGTFIVPTLCMGWRTIVISPLLALMADQEALMRRAGVQAARITSDNLPLHQGILSDWASGKIDIMLVSPERVSNPEWRSLVLQFPPDFIAMDECGSGDTEILTDRGFVRFDLLDKTEKVAQYDQASGEISFVLPLRWVERAPSTSVMAFRNGSGADFHLTAGHQMLYHDTRRAELRKVSLKDLKLTPYNRIIKSGKAVGGDATLSPVERLAICLQADGRVQGDQLHFRFRKFRKIARLLALLGEMEVPPYYHKTNESGTTLIKLRVVDLPRRAWVKSIHTQFELAGLSLEKCRAIIEEMNHWDGHRVRGSDVSYVYTNTDKLAVDFYQAVALLADYGTSVVEVPDERSPSFSVCYRLRIHKTKTFFSAQRFSVGPLATQPEKVYCVEVPTGCIIVRRAGHVMVTGNCHTFSNWADTFRAGFKFAGDFIRLVNPKVVLALSATMPDEMEAEVRAGLGIQNARRVFHFPRRKNLNLHTLDLKSPTHFAPWVATHCPGSTIVYCATRANVESTCADIQRYVADGRQVVFYHGGITSPAIKKAAQDTWTLSDDAIIVATNAFGMGIDKARVRNVVHFDLPGTLSALSQEVGRAGRDGEPAHCWAYPNPKSISTQKYFIRIGNPTEQNIRDALRQFETMKDINGVIHASRLVVAQRAAIDIKLMAAVMTFMYGEKLVEEVKDCGTPARLKWSDSIPSFTPAEAQTRDALANVSREVGGWLEFDIEELARELNLKPDTVGSRLTSLANKNLVTYVRQDSRKPIRIIGDVDAIDYTRLNRKAAEAMEKLDEVVAYCDVPDEDKHDYLERTLKTSTPPPA